MRERAGAQRRQVPAVPGAYRGGGPGVRGVVNYTTGGIISDRKSKFCCREKWEKKERKKDFFLLLYRSVGLQHIYTCCLAVGQQRAARACVRCVIDLLKEFTVGSRRG